MRIIVGISGASGAILGYELLRSIKQFPEVESHLVITKSGIRTLAEETPYTYADISRLADFVHDDDDVGAIISSGSFITAGMVVVPCSMKTLSAIANSYDANLLVRAADVCLKENRRVVLVPREMPMNKNHIRNMQLCADAGCCIIPPVMTFYNHPKSIDDHIQHIIGKILMQFGLTNKEFKPWVLFQGNHADL